MWEATKNLLKKKVWPIFIAGCSVFTFFGVLPENWKQSMTWLASIDEWINANAAYPGLFMLSATLFLGTVALPWAVGFFSKHRAIERIWELHKAGIFLRQEADAVSSEASFYEWRRKYREWEQEIFDEAKKVSFHLHNWLKNIHQVDGHSAKPNAEYQSNEFAACYMVCLEIMLRLERYLTRQLILRE